MCKCKVILVKVMKTYLNSILRIIKMKFFVRRHYTLERLNDLCIVVMIRTMEICQIILYTVWY